MPYFLPRPEDLEGLHAALQEDFGGKGGGLDRPRLEAELAPLADELAEQDPGACALAGAYLQTIARGQAVRVAAPRLAATAAAWILEANGYRLACPPADLADLATRVAAGKAGAAEATAFFLASAHPFT